MSKIRLFSSQLKCTSSIICAASFINCRKVESQGLPFACLLLPMVCCSALYFSLNHARDLSCEEDRRREREREREREQVIDTIPTTNLPPCKFKTWLLFSSTLQICWQCISLCFVCWVCVLWQQQSFTSSSTPTTSLCSTLLPLESH